MSIYKPKDGTYCYNFQYTNPVSKKKTRKYRQGFKSKKDAKDAEAMFLAQVQLKDKNRITFKALTHDFFEHRKLHIKELSFKNNVRILEKYIYPTFQNMIVEDINRIDVREWVDYLSTLDRSAKYKNDCIELFKSIIKHGRLYFEIDNDPTIIIKKFANPKKRVFEEQVWDIHEFSDFIYGFDSSNSEEYVYKLFFQTLCFSGARRGEIKALQFSDLNFEKNTISITKSASGKHKGRVNIVKKPKTESSVRVIAMDKVIMNEFYQYMRKRQLSPTFKKKEFIFIRSENNKIPLADQTIANYRDRICEKTVVKRIRIHDLRHSNATLLLSNGINVEVVSKRLGHAHTSMTYNVYTHVLPFAEQKSIELLNDMHALVIKSNK